MEATYLLFCHNYPKTFFLRLDTTLGPILLYTIVLNDDLHVRDLANLFSLEILF